MNILFDQGVPVPLRRFLHPHTVDTAAERGWSQLRNGDLLNQAESQGYDLFVTTDKNLRYQQNLTARKIGVLVLSTTSWPRIKQHVETLRGSLEAMAVNGYEEVTIP